MTPHEAATLIGCSVRHVRVLCNKGILRASQKEMPGGFYWVVNKSSALAYANTPQKQGYPRGKKR